MAQHNEVAGSVVEVNAAVVPGAEAKPRRATRRVATERNGVATNAHLTWGGSGLGNRTGESAEAVVARKPVKAGGAKGRTGKERSDRVEDDAPADAREGEGASRAATREAWGRSGVMP